MQDDFILGRLVTFALLLPFASAGMIQARNSSNTCKVIPSAASWPSSSAWSSLNETVHGNLIATVPQAAICHTNGFANLEYNETACTALRDAWNAPQT